MKQSTVLKKGNEWYSVTVGICDIEMRQRPITNRPKTIVTKKVTTKAPKAGSKISQAIELYKKHVVDAKMTADDFVQLLITNLNMTLAGAKTYRYTCRKVVSA